MDCADLSPCQEDLMIQGLLQAHILCLATEGIAKTSWTAGEGHGMGTTLQHCLKETRVLVLGGNPAMCGAACHRDCCLMGLCPGWGLQSLPTWGHPWLSWVVTKAKSLMLSG